MTGPSLYNRAGDAIEVDVRAIREYLITFLQGLERDGIHTFVDHELWFHPTHGRGAKQLSAWGVRHAVSMEVRPDRRDEPRLQLSSSQGGWVDPALITRAVEREANKQDNREKLGACPDARRRHLYVGLTSAGKREGMAWWALLEVLAGEMGLPPIPTLPPEITTVWAGTGTGAIYATPPGQWDLFRTDGSEVVAS